MHHITLADVSCRHPILGLGGRKVYSHLLLHIDVLISYRYLFHNILLNRSTLELDPYVPDTLQIVLFMMIYLVGLITELVSSF